MWVREWIEKRDQSGTLNNLITELHQDEMHFENFLRLKKGAFDYIVEKVRSRIRRKGISIRRAITSKERLNYFFLISSSGMLSSDEISDQAACCIVLLK
nr:unnamed protein product [Callosobruchus chinensis]